MNTTFWGPSGWEFLHTLTFIYPVNPSFGDKVKMREFMNSLCFILPCKYCRLSFTKYIKSLPIDEYLESRDTMIDWLYKIHNKINKKLRIQGFCKHSNPELTTVTRHYKTITQHICKLLNKNTEIVKTKSNNEITIIKNTINYICNLGQDFLGSIIFNYQGYFTNCHTGNEKVRIVSVYNTFFNSIIPLLCSYISKFCKDGKDCVARYKDESYTKFNIRSILMQNEPYSKLVKWFYKCDDLCSLEDTYTTEEKYETHFNKHIVMSCDNPIASKKNKTCRNTVTRKNRTKRRFTTKKSIKSLNI